MTLRTKRVFCPFRNDYAVLVLWLFSLTAMLTSCINDDEDDNVQTALVNVGDKVPDFTLTGSDGSVYTSASLIGQVYILSFFDTGCPDCQEEFQVLQRIYDQYSPDVPVLNVPRSQTAEQVQAYWTSAGLTMPFHIPADKALYYQFATKTIPRTYIVDGNGTVIAAYDDSPIADYDTIDAILKELFSK